MAADSTPYAMVVKCRGYIRGRGVQTGWVGDQRTGGDPRHNFILSLSDAFQISSSKDERTLSQTYGYLGGQVLIDSPDVTLLHLLSDSPLRDSATDMDPRRPAKVRRRQNHSCDQCYRAKRACDGTGRNRGEVCSNCARTAKQCTFEKAERHHRRSRLSGIEMELPWRVQESGHFEKTTPCKQAPPIASVHHQSLPTHSLNDWNITSPSFSISAGSSSQATEHFDEYAHHCFMGTEPKEPTLSIESLDFRVDEPVTRLPWELGMPELARETEEQGSDDDLLFETTDSVFSTNTDRDFGCHMGWPSQRARLFGREEEMSSLGRSPSFYSPSSDTLAYSLAERTNKSLISDSLMVIYHDTMENALSCWLTEQTCPYSLEGIIEIGSSPRNPWDSEWGASWTNRVVKSICQLDRPSCILRERPLARWENEGANRALKACIMAFAAQWSHSASENFEDLEIGPNEITGDFTTSLYGENQSGFDRSLQELLWNEARRTLQVTAGMDSFRVIFAQFLFAMTQRPVQRDKFIRLRHLRARYAGRDTSTWNSGSSNTTLEGTTTPISQPYPKCVDDPDEVQELQDLLDLQGPPIYLEMALSQLSATRIRLERADAATATRRKQRSISPSDTADRKAFNHLFWLLMMCDTLSGAINKRSLIVSDEDSLILQSVRSINSHDESSTDKLESAQGETFPTPSMALEDDESNSTPWGTFFPRRSRLRNREDAAVLLAEAAPVKVLLFRKVKRLQDLYFRRAGPKRLEAAILDALNVYEHWNTYFGDFIAHCIKNHENLPSRVQSWYSIIAGHWHLATFLLSDWITRIDQTQRGDKLHSALRQSCRLVFEMRKHSAFQVADLGRVARPLYNSDFRQRSGLHFSVNQGALLTEPWTEILIRSFSRASDQFLRWLSGRQAQDLATAEWWSSEGQETLITNCNYCNKALFGLGRKSDMAFLAAVSFSQRLQSLQQNDKTFNDNVVW